MVWHKIKARIIDWVVREFTDYYEIKGELDAMRRDFNGGYDYLNPEIEKGDFANIMTDRKHRKTLKLLNKFYKSSKEAYETHIFKEANRIVESKILSNIKKQ